MSRLISVIVSVYNEEACLNKFYDETGKVLRGLSGENAAASDIPDSDHANASAAGPHSDRTAASAAGSRSVYDDAAESCSDQADAAFAGPYSRQTGADTYSRQTGAGPYGRQNADSGSTRWEMVFINDGSTDDSARILDGIRENDPGHVTVISFSKNFGHEAAMTAGLDYARGDILIFMDADLQHPPALIPEIIAKFDEGSEIVNMVRSSNVSAGSAKNLTSAVFYKFINRISGAEFIPGASDFFAIDKKAADVLRTNYRMKVRFIRGFVQNIGFRKTEIEYEALERAAGESHYSLGSLWRLSVDVILSFSDLPLRLGIYLGLLAGLLGVVLIIYTFITRGGAPSGYATIVITICFMSAAVFTLLGIMGAYISLIYREIQDRPIYIAANVELAETDPCERD